MKYGTGDEVCVGDIVAIHSDGAWGRGEVIQLVAAESPEAKEWAAPRGGALIQGDRAGLFVVTSLEDDEDIELLHRADGDGDELRS